MNELAARGRSATADQLRQFMYRVCQPTRASSRLMFALMVALAAPAWRMLGRQPACFHFYGCPPDRDALALVPASLFGKLELTQWAAVSREPIAVAVSPSDGLLVLVQDDDPHRIGMLMAIGALWGSHHGIAMRQQPIRSRTDALTISAGDILIDQTNVFVAAPALRGGLWLVDVPSDAGAGHGVFEQPQPAGSGDQIAIALMQLQGAVGLHWVEALNGGWKEAEALLTSEPTGAGFEPSGAVDLFTQLPTHELVRGFRTIALVGELATAWGFTGWLPGEPSAAVWKCWQAMNAASAARIAVATGRRLIA